MRFERSGSRRIDAQDQDLRPAILAIGTAVPPFVMDQRAMGEWMAASLADRPGLARLVHTMHRVSGIEKRYSCIPDYALPVEASAYAPGQSKQRSATTGDRMSIYARESVPVGVTAARRALAKFAHHRSISLAQAASSITHLVVVTCTGFFAPGLDFVLTQELGLAPTVNRTMIGFMGCAAMFNGLRIASQAVEADATANVLVVSVELCTLHSQPESRERDVLVAASLFGDGASACVVGHPSPESGEHFRLEQFVSVIKPNTGDEMVWTVGDHGFQLHLSPRIPDHLVDAAPHTLADLFGAARPAFWAIHPGGRAILDRLAQIFRLDDEQMQPSRDVLRRVGNVSSATLLFVLDAVRDRLACQSCAQEGEARNNGRGNGANPHIRACQGVAMAFGPGLVIEMARLTFVPEVDPGDVVSDYGARRGQPARLTNGTEATR